MIHTDHIVRAPPELDSRQVSVGASFANSQHADREIHCHEVSACKRKLAKTVQSSSFFELYNGELLVFWSICLQYTQKQFETHGKG